MSKHDFWVLTIFLTTKRVILYQKLHLGASWGQSYATFYVLSEHPQRVCFYIDHIGIRYLDPGDYHFWGKKVAFPWGVNIKKKLVLYNGYKHYWVKFRIKYFTFRGSYPKITDKQWISYPIGHHLPTKKVTTCHPQGQFFCTHHRVPPTQKNFRTYISTQ